MVGNHFPLSKLELKRTQLELSSLIQLSEYASLIKPTVLSTLKSPSPYSRWVVAEARLDQELVALSLSEVFPLYRIAQLESLVVIESHRRSGFGRQLLGYTQDLLVKEEKILAFEVFYEQEALSAPAIEKIIASLGWLPAKIFLIRCHFNAYAFNPPWIRHSFRLPSDMQFFSWKELRPQDRAFIEYLNQQGRFLPYLSPLRDEAHINLETSIGLRKQDQLVGWSITRRTEAETLLYSSLYADASLQQSGYGIQLLIESIHRHKQLPIPNAIFEMIVKEIDPSWWRFIQKRLMPLANKIERIKRAGHIFLPNKD